MDDLLFGFFQLRRTLTGREIRPERTCLQSKNDTVRDDQKHNKILNLCT